MTKRVFALAAAAFFSVSVLACSSSSDAGSKAASGQCPAVGDKVCSNDPAFAQSDVDECNKDESDPKCGSLFTTYYECLGQHVSCDSNGHNQETSPCTEQATDYGNCTAGSSGDAGSGDAG